MIYIGVDPGVSGGFGEICADDAEGHKMPETERDIWNWVKYRRNPCFAVIEKVHAMVGRNEDGTRRVQGVSSTWKFSGNYHGCRMALIPAGIPFEEVLPKKWQAVFGLLSRQGESHTDKKNRHKAMAQQLFPALKVTHAIADALLIAEYCRRTRQGF